MTQDRRIWVIGGTSESAQLAIALAQASVPCTISVTTQTAEALYPLEPLQRVWIGKMDATQVKRFLHEEGIVAILDASHPYAVEISRIAIAAATQHQIPYLRYERPALATTPPIIEGGKSLILPLVKGGLREVLLPNFETLIAGDYLAGQRVLLTIGYRTLPQFRPWQDQCTLFARLLPSVTALEAALAAGFSPDRLIAIRPPVPIELERALWQHWQISMVVTKASGTPGGEDIKRQLATELRVSLIIIDRPAIDYPQQTHNLSAALTFCCQHIS